LYIAAVVRCAPPDNKPLPEERGNCLPYLIRELQLLTELRVIVPLGKFAWDGVLAALETLGAEREHRPSAGRRARSTPRPSFGHLAETSIGRYSLLGSYHPSQQNTFTGRLTPAMLDAVWRRSRDLAGLD
jgi:uracil-DNA glycosylase